MRAGALTSIISIWKLQKIKSESGGYTDNWVFSGQYRAEKITQNARKAMNSGEIWYPRAAIFRCRLGADVNEGDRVNCDDAMYDIVSVIIDRDRERLITINAELHNE